MIKNLKDIPEFELYIYIYIKGISYGKKKRLSDHWHFFLKKRKKEEEDLASIWSKKTSNMTIYIDNYHNCLAAFSKAFVP